MPKTKSSDPEVMSASDVRQHFGDVVNRVARGEGRIIVEKNGAPAVGLVSMDDVRQLRTRDERMAERQAKLRELQLYYDQFPADEWEREVDNAFEEIREERRAALRPQVGVE